MKFVVQDLTSGGIDWQREKWQSGLGSKFIHQGEKNAAKYADEVMAFVTRTAVLDAMNQGMTEMLKKYSALVELNFLTKPHYVKI